MKTKKLVTAMFALAVLLSTISAAAFAQDVTDQQASDQLNQILSHFDKKGPAASFQTNALNVAATPTLEFRITKGRQYTVAFPQYFAGFTGDEFEYQVVNNNGCSVYNSFTDKSFSWNGTPQTFVVPAVTNGLIGGQFVLKCTNSSSTVFGHIYNVGMVAVLEGRERIAPAGQGSHTFDGVSFVPDPKFAWVAAGGAPGQGMTDKSGSFSTAFAGAGWHLLEASFGPDPNTGQTFRTRTGFFAQGTGTLVVISNRVGYLLTAVGGAIEPGFFSINTGGWPGNSLAWELPSGIVEGGSVLIVPPAMFKGRRVTGTYTCYGVPEPAWQQAIDPR